MHTIVGEHAGIAFSRKELRGAEASFRNLAEAIGLAIFVSQGKRLHYVNRTAETTTGYTREELLSMNFWDLVDPDFREAVVDRERFSEEGIVAPAHPEVKIVAKNGEERWLDIATGIIEFDGALSSLVSAFDLTERKRSEVRLRRLAVTDPLTGLGNYGRLVEALDAEVKRSGRTGRPFAVLVLDLDGLKKINDRYGHLIGNRALCRLADVLRIDSRATDTAARCGGDEFAIILPETSAAAAELVASHIHERLASDNRQPPLSVSIGVAVYPQGGETSEALLCTADRELYRMKNRRPEELIAAIIEPPACFEQTHKSHLLKLRASS